MLGMPGIELYSGLICALVLSLACRAGEDWLRPFTWGFARRFTPGYHMMGFQPSKQSRIVAELEALQAEVDALKGGSHRELAGRARQDLGQSKPSKCSDRFQPCLLICCPKHLPT